MEKSYQELLSMIQEDFPLEERPFAVLGKKVGLSEEEVINFLKEMQEKGILRHLGASLILTNLNILLVCAHAMSRKIKRTF